MEIPARSLLSAAPLQGERFARFSQSTEYFSIPCQGNRLIYPCSATLAIPHKLPLQKLSRGQRQPKRYSSASELRSLQWGSTDPISEMLVPLPQHRAVQLL